MLEAVNSVLSNAQYTKAVVEQQSVTNSYAANPERIQQASTQAPYLSLYIKVDTNFDKAILQIRDNQSGDVLRQIPTESQLEAYRRAQSSNAVRPREAQEVAEQLAPEPETKVFVSSSYTGEAPTTQAQLSTPAPAQKEPASSSDTPAPTVTVDTQA